MNSIITVLGAFSARRVRYVGYSHVGIGVLPAWRKERRVSPGGHQPQGRAPRHGGPLPDAGDGGGLAAGRQQPSRRNHRRHGLLRRIRRTKSAPAGDGARRRIGHPAGAQRRRRAHLDHARPGRSILRSRLRRRTSPMASGAARPRDSDTFASGGVRHLPHHLPAVPIQNPAVLDHHGLPRIPAHLHRLWQQ